MPFGLLKQSAFGGDFVRVAVVAESVDDAGAEIGIDVDAGEGRIFFSAINVAADHASILPCRCGQVEKRALRFHATLARCADIP